MIGKVKLSERGFGNWESLREISCEIKQLGNNLRVREVAWEG